MISRSACGGASAQILMEGQIALADHDSRPGQAAFTVRNVAEPDALCGPRTYVLAAPTPALRAAWVDALRAAARARRARRARAATGLSAGSARWAADL